PWILIAFRPLKARPLNPQTRRRRRVAPVRLATGNRSHRDQPALGTLTCRGSSARRSGLPSGGLTNRQPSYGACMLRTGRDLVSSSDRDEPAWLPTRVRGSLLFSSERLRCH